MTENNETDIQKRNIITILLSSCRIHIIIYRKNINLRVIDLY